MAVVVFRSKVTGEVIMMRNHVEPIFKQAGIVFHDKGAFLAEDLPAVIQSLEKVIDAVAQNEVPEDEDEAKEKPGMLAAVGIRTRFYSLLKLLRKAADKGVNVHWEPLS